MLENQKLLFYFIHSSVNLHCLIFFDPKTCSKIRNFILFYSKQCQFTMIYLSSQSQRCQNPQCFGQYPGTVY
jgi:hypothetical protein